MQDGSPIGPQRLRLDALGENQESDRTDQQHHHAVTLRTNRVEFVNEKFFVNWYHQDDTALTTAEIIDCSRCCRESGGRPAPGIVELKMTSDGRSLWTGAARAAVQAWPAGATIVVSELLNPARERSGCTSSA